MRTIVYTVEIDDRFGAGKVNSCIDLSLPARSYSPQTLLFNDITAEHKLKPIHYVSVDESQFLAHEQVHELFKVVDTPDTPVPCYGLRTDFRGELFTGSQYLLAWSDKLVELRTIYSCGRKASMVLRLNQKGRPYNEGKQVVIDDNERYVSVCRKHYREVLSAGSLTQVQNQCYSRRIAQKLIQVPVGVFFIPRKAEAWNWLINGHRKALSDDGACSTFTVVD